VPTGMIAAKLSKPGLLKKFDDASKTNPPRIQVEELLARLRRKDPDLVQIGIDFGWIEANGDDDKHLRRDWLNETGKGWWPKLPVRAVVREGFVQAVQAFLAGHGAGSYSRTLDFTWAQDQPKDGTVFCAQSSSGVQISVTIHTPPVPRRVPVPPNLPEDRDIVIVEAGRGGKVVVYHPRRIPDLRRRPRRGPRPSRTANRVTG
jgi:hypothetical protein